MRGKKIVLKTFSMRHPEEMSIKALFRVALPPESEFNMQSQMDIFCKENLDLVNYNTSRVFYAFPYFFMLI